MLDTGKKFRVPGEGVPMTAVSKLNEHDTSGVSVSHQSVSSLAPGGSQSMARGFEYRC